MHRFYPAAWVENGQAKPRYVDLWTAARQFDQTEATFSFSMTLQLWGLLLSIIATVTTGWLVRQSYPAQKKANGLVMRLLVNVRIRKNILFSKRSNN